MDKTGLDDFDPRPYIIRNFIWDMFPHNMDMAKIQASMGLVPSDDDGLDVEHEQSDTRGNRAAPLASTLTKLSGYAAEVAGELAVAYMENKHGEAFNPPPGFKEAFAQQNAQIIDVATSAIFAHLLDTGVIEYGKALRNDE